MFGKLFRKVIKKSKYYGHKDNCCIDDNIKDYPYGSGYAECQTCHRIFIKEDWAR